MRMGSFSDLTARCDPQHAPSGRFQRELTDKLAASNNTFVYQRLIALRRGPIEDWIHHPISP